MENLSLKASARKLSKTELAQARKNGQIPAVIYGREFDNQYLTVDDKEFDKLYQQSGESTLIDLSVDKGQPVKVIIQDLQKDVLTDQVIHIDFYAVKMDEEIETEIELEFIGVSSAVKESGGILVKSAESLNVKCLPQNLVKELTVDISNLKTFDDVIRVKDLNIPETLEVLDDPELSVATVSEPRSDEELASLDEKVEGDVNKVEVAGEKEKTEEASEEASSEDAKKDQEKKPEEKK